MRIAPFLLLLLALGIPQAQAQYWTGTLADGTLVRVDPRTQRAEHFTPRGAAQLWDGAHRMQDGSVIIVKEGVIQSGTPAAAGPLPQAEPAAPQPEETPSATAAPGAAGPQDPACIHLVIKVCGFDGQCGAGEACSPARQMLALEEDELRQGLPPQTTRHCHEALGDESFFTPCTATEKRGPTPCRQLVDAVCGPAGECGDAEACAAAWQLLDMEGQEIGATLRRPERWTDSSLRCREALGDQRFFQRCVPAAQGAPAR
jgi:hypothetical protein